MSNETIRVYDNIFYSYGKRGEELQSENNITKALINVFQHSHIDLINKFLTNELELEANFINNLIKFKLQVKKPFEQKFKKAFVLGISDKLPEYNNINKVEDKNFGVPDAAFISNDLCILIEVKVRNNKLTLGQIKRQEKVFDKGQYISEPKFKTWDQVLEFLKKQKEELKGEKYSITRFLIHQFIDFCAINGVGTRKSKEFYFMCFPKDIRQLVRDVDNYISTKYKEELDPSRKARSGGISYTRKEKRGFFAKLDSNFHILILSTKPSIANAMQEQFNQLGIASIRNLNRTHWGTPAREALIDLNKVRSLEEIKHFIDEAFEKRP